MEHCVHFRDVFGYYHTCLQCVFNLNTSMNSLSPSYLTCKNTCFNRVSLIIFIFFSFSIFELIWKGCSTKRALGACCTRSQFVLSEQESDCSAIVYQLKFITFIILLDLRTFHIKKSIYMSKLQNSGLKGSFIGANKQLDSNALLRVVAFWRYFSR